MRAFGCLFALIGACWSRRTVALVLPFAFVAFLSSACDILDPPALEVKVAVNPPRFAVGDASEITVTVVNRTMHHIRVGGGSCLISFVVLDSAGDFVAPKSYCQTFLAYEDIEPHGRLVRSFTWRGETWDTDPGSFWLPAGPYSVVGVLDGVERKEHSSPVNVELF